MNGMQHHSEHVFHMQVVKVPVNRTRAWGQAVRSFIMVAWKPSEGIPWWGDHVQEVVSPSCLLFPSSPSIFAFQAFPLVQPVWPFHPSIVVHARHAICQTVEHHASPQIAQTPSPDVDWLVLFVGVLWLARHSSQLWGTAGRSISGKPRDNTKTTSRIPRRAPRQPASCTNPRPAASAWPLHCSDCLLSAVNLLRRCPAAASCSHAPRFGQDEATFQTSACERRCKERAVRIGGTASGFWGNLVNKKSRRLGRESCHWFYARPISN